jgi:hypothetical protein
MSSPCNIPQCEEVVAEVIHRESPLDLAVEVDPRGCYTVHFDRVCPHWVSRHTLSKDGVQVGGVDGLVCSLSGSVTEQHLMMELNLMGEHVSP